MGAADLVEAVRALARLARVLERLSGELSLAQYRVLAAIGAGDQRASRVASRLSLGRPAVSASVDALLARGLVIRSPAGDDGRVSWLALTDDGRALLDRMERVFADRLRALCARTGDGTAVVDALVMLGNALEAETAERARLGGSRRAGGTRT